MTAYSPILYILYPICPAKVKASAQKKQTGRNFSGRWSIISSVGEMKRTENEAKSLLRKLRRKFAEVADIASEISVRLHHFLLRHDFCVEFCVKLSQFLRKSKSEEGADLLTLEFYAELAHELQDELQYLNDLITQFYALSEQLEQLCSMAKASSENAKDVATIKDYSKTNSEMRKEIKSSEKAIAKVLQQIQDATTEIEKASLTLSHNGKLKT